MYKNTRMDKIRWQDGSCQHQYVRNGLKHCTVEHFSGVSLHYMRCRHHEVQLEESEQSYWSLSWEQWPRTKKKQRNIQWGGNEGLDIVLPERPLSEEVNMSLSRQVVMKLYRLYHDVSNFENECGYSGVWMWKVENNHRV